MKKLLSILFLLMTSFVLVACELDQTPGNSNNVVTHTVSVYGEDGTLLNNYFIENNNLFDENTLSSFELIIGKDFSHWSLSSNGEPFDFTTPITGTTKLYVVVEGGIPVEPDPTDPEDPTPVVPGEFDVTLYSGYYQGVGLNEYVDRALLSNLKTAIRRNYSPGSYKSSYWGTLKAADIALNSPGNIWSIYNSELIPINRSGGNSGDWNKEHVVPQSWLKSAGLGSYTNDQHNLRASNVRVNSDRGNLKFIDRDGSFGTYGGGFYPGDEHIGDVARILMYMLVIHDGSSLTIDKFFVNNSWDTLIKWHLNDPVDEFEIKRNQVIFEREGNRNPFIDHPDLAYFVWNQQYGDMLEN